MRAIWSFWSKPYLAQQGSTWLSPTDHLYSCALSLECARRHFKKTELYTDDAGAELLINKLKLPFSKVVTSLNDISHYDCAWWTLGKLHTYSKQSSPFVHIDNDVYLWKALPERFMRADIIGQNPEYFQTGSSWYQPEKFDPIIKSQHWLPDEIIQYREQKLKTQMAVCCGIMGGSDLNFIKHYAKQAIKLINYSLTKKPYQPLYADNLLIEQYLLATHINYNRQCKPAYLFNSTDAAFDPTKSKAAGFTHLIGGAKRNQALMNRLHNRLCYEYPEHYEKINELTAHNPDIFQL